MGQIIRTNTQLFCHLLCRQFPGDIVVDILQKLLRDIQIRRLVLFDHWDIFTSGGSSSACCASRATP